MWTHDLVFVFAITQVSHLLIEDLTWRGAGQALIVLLVVWWAWNFTTWMSNELDLASPVVRGVLIVVMLATLALAVAIPDAFGDDALLFAGAYVAIQVGRHTFLTLAWPPGTRERERTGRILTWFCASGALWLGGALADGELRVALWLVALAIDYGGPLALFRVPGRPRLSGATWDVRTDHFAERFSLFVIIALGESIVLTGATTSALGVGAATLAGFALAFLVTVALWWLYFGTVTTIAQRLELARTGWRVQPAWPSVAWARSRRRWWSGRCSWPCSPP